MPKYSVVVPVYNSKETLEMLYSRLKHVFDAECGGNFELILVDDSSKDDSAAEMRRLREKDKRIKLIFLARNFGQHRALLCGFHYATGEYVVTMDDDLQHPPEEIPKLISYLREHPETDVVIGRYASKKHSLLRNLGTKMTNWFTSKIFRKNRDLQLTSFRLMRRYVVMEMCNICIATPRIGHMLLQITNRIENVTVQHDARLHGKSGYTFGQLVKDFLSNILTNSDLPLLLLGKFGVFSFGISIILIGYYIVRYFVCGISIAGFTTLVVLLLAFGGLILCGMGLIGRYLVQLSRETKKMPNYVVRTEEVN